MKRFFVSLLAVLFVVVASAQDRQQNREERRRQRIEHKADRLANEFGLNQEQAAAFKTLYVEYREALHNASAQRPECARHCNGQTLTDEQAAQMLQQALDFQQAKAEASVRRAGVKREFATRFSQLLTAEQTLRVIACERNAHQHNRQMHRGGGQRGRAAHHGQRRGGHRRGGHADCRRQAGARRACQHEGAGGQCGQHNN